MHRSWRRPLVLLTTALVLAGAGAAGQEAGGPRAVVDAPVADLGLVTRGETASHDFIVRNAGTETLEITDVRPACGCTVAEFTKSIPAGESGRIHATLDTSSLTGGSAKHIAVFTNDPENPRLQLTLKVKVEELLLFNPGFARFVQSHGAGIGRVEQLFYSPDFADLRIEKVASPYPFLAVDYREATAEEVREEGAGRQWVVTVALDYDAAPVGPITGEVEVATNHPKQQTARLPVSGFVRPMLAVTPSVADFQTVEVKEPVVAHLQVKNFAPFAVRVTGAETDVAGIETEIATEAEGKVYYVVLTLTPKMPKGEFAGTLKIHTDSERQPLLEVDLSGTVL